MDNFRDFFAVCMVGFIINWLSEAGGKRIICYKRPTFILLET